MDKLRQLLLGNSWHKGSAFVLGLAIVVFAEEFGLLPSKLSLEQLFIVGCLKIGAVAFMVGFYCFGQGLSDQGKGAVILEKALAKKNNEKPPEPTGVQK